MGTELFFTNLQFIRLNRRSTPKMSNGAMRNCWKRSTKITNNSEKIDGDSELSSDDTPNWIEYFESVKFEQRIEETWKGNSIGGLISWLEEFLSRGWKVSEIQSYDDSSDLKVKFMKM